MLLPSQASRLSRWISKAVVLILIVLCIRLGVTVWRTETGGESVWNQWRAATVGWLVEEDPLHERLPVDQAKYWLKEVERVVADHPSDPEVLMGAALVLDSPCSDFESVRFQVSKPMLGGMLPIHLSRNDEGIRSANLEFERLCGVHSIELANTARQLEPQNHTWTRLASLLLCKSDGYYNSASPRIADWIARLEEYERADPENGFYDYLAALAYWEACLKLERNPGDRDSRLTVGDEARFERGAQWFSRGQQHAFVSMGQEEASAVAKFLELTSLSPLGKEKVLHGRNLTTLRRSRFFRAVWRWQWELARAKRENGDAAAAVELLRQDLRLIDQYLQSAEQIRYDSFVAAHRTLTLKTIQGILRENGAPFGKEELAHCDRQLFASMLEDAVIRAAAKSKEISDPSRPAQSLILEKPLIAAISLVVGLALQSTVVFLALFGLTSLTARCFSASRSSDVNGLTLGLAFPLAAVASIAFLGLAPAEVISVGVQQWIATIGLILGPLLLIAIVVSRWLRSSRFQFSLTKLFWVVTLLSLYLGIFVFARQFDAFAQVPFDLFVPSSGTQAVYWLVRQPNNDAVTLCWRVTLEWLAYQGPYLTLAFWLVIVLIAAGIGARRIEPGNGGLLTRIGNCCGIYFRGIARSSVWLFFLSLIVYLSLVPAVLKLVESDYQWRMSFARNPRLHLDRTKAAVEAIRSDATQMAELREQVEESMEKDALNPLRQTL